MCHTPISAWVHMTSTLTGEVFKLYYLCIIYISTCSPVYFLPQCFSINDYCCNNYLFFCLKNKYKGQKVLTIQRKWKCSFFTDGMRRLAISTNLAWGNHIFNSNLFLEEIKDTCIMPIPNIYFCLTKCNPILKTICLLIYINLCNIK